MATRRITPEVRSSELWMVDLNEKDIYAKDEVRNYEFDTPLPKNVEFIAIEFDRAVTGDDQHYTQPISYAIEYKDGKNWIHCGGMHEPWKGGIDKRQRIESEGVVAQEARDIPTCGTIHTSQIFSGKTVRVLVTSYGAQSLSTPRIMVGLY